MSATSFARFRCSKIHAGRDADESRIYRDDDQSTCRAKDPVSAKRFSTSMTPTASMRFDTAIGKGVGGPKLQNRVLCWL
jgi:hypothetical protein